VVMYVLRLLLAPLWEALVLLDRLLYLRERGYAAALLPLFDPTLSPRSYALIAVSRPPPPTHAAGTRATDGAAQREGAQMGVEEPKVERCAEAVDEGIQLQMSSSTDGEAMRHAMRCWDCSTSEAADVRWADAVWA
jgi:hypothetical protein